MQSLPERDPPHPPHRTAGRRGSDPLAWLDNVSVDRDAEIPVGTQLVWALRARIGDERLTAGQRLPGVRELASMFDINPNTARAIYQRLEREGLIESRQGTGTFVAHHATPPTGIGRLATDAARRARELGVDPRELAAALYVTAEPPRTSAGDGERRRQLREQIAALEQALAEMQSHDPSLLSAPPPSSSPSRSTPGPRLLSAAELEEARAELVRRLSRAQLARDNSAPTAEPETRTARARSAPKRAASASRRAPRPSARPSTA